MRAALGELGVDLDPLRSIDPDVALGNGSLGHLSRTHEMGGSLSEA
jgi:starch phosphorylase